MNFTPFLFCISLIMSFAAAKDLKCYTCFYYEGHPYSDSSCLQNPEPETLKNCTQSLIPGLVYGRTPQLNLTLSDTKLCHKYSATLNGKTIVIRGCNVELETVQLNSTNTAIILFEGEIAKDAEARFCSASNCNGPSKVLISTTKLPHNEASRYRLTPSVLVTVIIYSIYKFVS